MAPTRGPATSSQAALEMHSFLQRAAATTCTRAMHAPGATVRCWSWSCAACCAQVTPLPPPQHQAAAALAVQSSPRTRGAAPRRTSASPPWWMTPRARGAAAGCLTRARAWSTRCGARRTCGRCTTPRHPASGGAAPRRCWWTRGASASLATRAPTLCACSTRCTCPAAPTSTSPPRTCCLRSTPSMTRSMTRSTTGCTAPASPPPSQPTTRYSGRCMVCWTSWRPGCLTHGSCWVTS
mmetsp:Transcript_15257/g.38036  ORF Transcript_15257/g.38036 Transcript_15257/m.38036 type:complete len:238 (+) Transcript_15257:317-1030(+)